jgi:hypothetical protein
MIQITKAIVAKEYTGNICPKQCLFYTKDPQPVNPCTTEVIPFLTKYLNLPNCSEGYIYVEDNK